jgi:hypothetical protein
LRVLSKKKIDLLLDQQQESMKHKVYDDANASRTVLRDQGVEPALYCPAPKSAIIDRPCRFYGNPRGCRNQNACNFAHDDNGLARKEVNDLLQVQPHYGELNCKDISCRDSIDCHYRHKARTTKRRTRSNKKVKEEQDDDMVNQKSKETRRHVNMAQKRNSAASSSQPFKRPPRMPPMPSPQADSDVFNSHGKFSKVMLYRLPRSGEMHKMTAGQIQLLVAERQISKEVCIDDESAISKLFV